MTPGRTGAVGSFVLALAIAVGAFGAHTLDGRLTPERMGTLDTAVTYQFYGGLGLLALAVLGAAGPRYATPAARRAATLLSAGLLLFCGALYGLVAGGPSLLGLAAPFGGVAMIGAWAYLGIALWRGPVRSAH